MSETAEEEVEKKIEWKHCSYYIVEFSRRGVHRVEWNIQ